MKYWIKGIDKQKIVEKLVWSVKYLTFFPLLAHGFIDLRFVFFF